MNFLEAIEGTSGERLASAVLKFLIVNSSLFRECLIQKIIPHVPPGRAPTFRNGVACQTEYPTEGALGSGFIDLIVSDGQLGRPTFVVGVEVKLWAAFTPNQPKKYFDALDNLVDKDVARVVVFVLAPGIRKSDVEKHLKEQGASARATVITWEQIGEDLLRVRNEDAPPVAMAARWLLEYLAPCLRRMEIQGTPACYVGRGVIVGNAFQYDLLYKLKACVSAPGRITSRPTYVGFSCAATGRDDDALQAAPVWVGFAKDHAGEIVFGVDSPLPAGANDASLWNRRQFIPVDMSTGVVTVIELGQRVQSVLDRVQYEFDQHRHSGPHREVLVGTP